MNTYYKTKEYGSPVFRAATWLKLICLISTAFFYAGCDKYVEVDLPVDKQAAEDVFKNTPSAISAMSGIYTTIPTDIIGFTGSFSYSIQLGVAADELNDHRFRFFTMSHNAYSSTSTPGFWETGYRNFIYRLNAIIEGVSASDGIPQSSKNLILGEAKFMRAFFYFYLVNLYGDVPLVDATNFKTNALVSRSPVADIYTFIINDLIAAKANLSSNYLGPDLSTTTTERLRPNKATATALLARVYLYNSQWQLAEQEATEVINNPDYSLPSDLNTVFFKNSSEAIWQIQQDPLNPSGVATPEGRFFIPGSSASAVPNEIMATSFVNAIETGDLRKTNWMKTKTIGVKSYLYPFKYKYGPETLVQQSNQFEYIMIFRLAEQYLIRSEARARLGNIVGANSAENDLNLIRSRAGLTPTIATDGPTMLDAIAQERRIELFTEWGDRWLNLKRTGTIDAVMSVELPIKGGGAWAPYKALLPIPANEFLLNPSLRGHQNPGYTEQ